MFLALILFSVLAVSVQLPHLFGTFFLTHSILPVHLTRFCATLKYQYTFSKQLLIPPYGKLQRLQFIYVAYALY